MAKPGWFLPVRNLASEFGNLQASNTSVNDPNSSLPHRNNSRQSGTCLTVIQPRGPRARLREPGQRGIDGPLRQAQDAIATDLIYGTLDW